MSVFCGVAILITCLGLLGLMTFIIAQRTKEIGIRKVLGASVLNITSLLSKDFLMLVAIAIVVAIPVSWYFMHRWLQDFAYRVHIGWWIFAVAGILGLLIAFMTVAVKAARAAMVNPVKALRTE
jgi:putative ABC transport system permease protein